MKIRVIALLMVAVIALFAFASCGGDEETTNNVSEQTTNGDYRETEEVIGEEIIPEE